MLVEKAQRGESLSDRCNAVLATSIDFRHAWALWIVLFGSVVVRPERFRV